MLYGLSAALKPSAILPMPVQQAIWKVGLKPERLLPVRLPKEQLLEDMIAGTPEILSEEWMIIGRQEPTGFGGRIDLLAIAPDASLVLIELKRDRTPREIVAQSLDYAAWVEQLSSERILQIYQRYTGGKNLDAEFESRFGVKLDEETLNTSHQIVLVAVELDDATERIIQYLNDKGIAINALFFQVFQHGDDQLLSRAWMIDPGTTQANATATSVRTNGEKEPWNGEYYVSFGEGRARAWDDARQYGFVSAGGGDWYSRTLKLLKPDDRIWVKIPGVGFVGTGIVMGPAVREGDFEFRNASGNRLNPQQALTRATYHREDSDPEWFVPVKWVETVAMDNAFDEVGLFGNQNSVCRPATPKWRHTVERLKTHFKNWNQIQ